MDWLLILCSIVHVFMCPFTKVEESFNLQATHDILYHQTGIQEVSCFKSSPSVIISTYLLICQQYDHLEFPGVVPRTFLGPIAVSAVAAPFVSLFHVLEIPKNASLYLGTTPQYSTT